MIELAARKSDIKDAIIKAMGLRSNGAINACCGPSCRGCNTIEAASSSCGQCCTKAIRRGNSDCESCERACDAMMKYLAGRGLL